MLTTPILFLVFNRPDTTQEVFDKIREAKPKQLFVAADGPRPQREGEAEVCEEVRQLVLRQIDWDCEVKTLFREENLGCKNAVAGAISWFFSEVEQGIILEDDISPDLSFFTFCAEMLERYKEDERVMMVSGLNVATSWRAENQSYHFSYYGGIWGWASWRRAWDKYDLQMQAWEKPEVREQLAAFFPAGVWKEREKLYQDLYEGKINTWDLQWGFSRILQNGLSIIPSKNLIQNIGCKVGGTHITSSHPWESLPISPLSPPFLPPPFVMADVAYDNQHLGLSPQDRMEAIKQRVRKALKL